MVFIMVVAIVFGFLGWIAVVNERRMWLNIWYGLSAMQLIGIGCVMAFLVQNPQGFHTSRNQFFIVGTFNAITHIGVIICAYLYSRAFGVGMPEVFQLRVTLQDEADDADSDSEDDAGSITRNSFSDDGY